MNNFILRIDSVRKSFYRKIIDIRGKNTEESFNIIDDLNLLVLQGKITALIGGNGAGKTTLFNIISGFIKADKGKIEFPVNGIEKNIIMLKPHQIARLGIGIGRMFQDNHVFQNMSVLDNMLVADGDHSGEIPFTSLLFWKKNKIIEKIRIEKAEKIFNELFGKNNSFWQMRYQPANTLSYGQQRLLSLARLLMGNYKLLLLDEPTSGINPQVISQIGEIIRFFVVSKGLSVFLIEHNMKFVSELADICCFMSNGRITESGTPGEVIGNVEVRKLYMGV
jgi:ABC-type branched-subunit amino acid transport system ATPase component